MQLERAISEEFLDQESASNDQSPANFLLNHGDIDDRSNDVVVTISDDDDDDDNEIEEGEKEGEAGEAGEQQEDEVEEEERQPPVSPQSLQPSTSDRMHPSVGNIENRIIEVVVTISHDDDGDDNEKEKEQQRLCPLCLEQIVMPIITPCQHTFDLHCLEQWMERNKSCPYCRSDLPKSFLKKETTGIFSLLRSSLQFLFTLLNCFHFFFSLLLSIFE